ncbi:MAG TPA: AMP-binding protein, partial [Stenomitos sp.]
MDRSARAVFDCAQGTKIFGVNTDQWLQRTTDYSDRLQALTATGQFPRILLAQANPIEFMAGFMAACRAECPVFVGNPAWSIQEWQQALQITQPHQVWGTLPPSVEWQPPTTTHPGERGWIMIATGGSSGKLKFAIHTWQTLTAAVDGFQSFFVTPTIDSCCVLPLYHVSGLMQFMRSLLTGGKLVVLPFAELIQGQSRDSQWNEFLAAESAIPQTFYLSLVPTQLQRLLQHPQRVAWLQRFRT